MIAYYITRATSAKCNFAPVSTFIAQNINLSSRIEKYFVPRGPKKYLFCHEPKVISNAQSVAQGREVVIALCAHDSSGQPGVDYPILTSIPATSFKCQDQKSGYYADQETHCQVFHVCNNGKKISFLCPNGTIFQQSQLICDWWFKVDCDNSRDYYDQSANFLAEEERKRVEKKRLQSEFYRARYEYSNSNTTEKQLVQYDGRQNGRMNPFNHLVSNNFFNNKDHSTKHSRITNINTIHQIPVMKQKNQINLREDNIAQEIIADGTQSRLTKKKKTTSSIDGRTTQVHNYRQKDIYKYKEQVKLQEEDKDYVSAENLNAQRENKIYTKLTTVSSLVHSETTRNVINKTLPIYKEITIFRTSTTSPPETQHFAESSSFISHGSSNKLHHFNQLYDPAFIHNEESIITQMQKSYQTTENGATDQKLSLSDERLVLPTTMLLENTPIPTFNLSAKISTNFTYLNDHVSDNNTQHARQKDDHYGYKSQKPSFLSTDDKSYLPFQHATYAQAANSDSPYRTKNTHYIEKILDYSKLTVSPYTRQITYSQEFDVETATLDAIKKTYSDVTESTLNYSNAYFKIFRPLKYNISYDLSHENVSTQNRDTTELYINHEELVTSTTQQESSKILQENSADNTELPNYNHSISGIVISDMKVRNNVQTLDPSLLDHFLQHGNKVSLNNSQKIISTSSSYVPFTKSYRYATTSTTRSSSTPLGYYIKSIDLNPGSSDFMLSELEKKSKKSTYLPEARQAVNGNKSKEINSRPLNEKEHARSMLQSLQDIDNFSSHFGLNNIKVNQTSPKYPKSTEPLTLHSLALYVANTNDVYDQEMSTVVISDVTSTEKKIFSGIELPMNILTQHTITSYAELFNLNNAIENSITNDNSYYNSEETLSADEINDLDIQQSEGPLNAFKKSNSTRVREVAHLFTRALSAYLKDPDEFRKILNNIRPTEPPFNKHNQTSSVTLFTTEDYPSVTKERDEVLEFSDDNNRVRKKTFKALDLQTVTKKSTNILKETTYQPYYTFEYLTSINVYSKEHSDAAEMHRNKQKNLDNLEDSTDKTYVLDSSRKKGQIFDYELSTALEEVSSSPKYLSSPKKNTEEKYQQKISQPVLEQRDGVLANGNYWSYSPKVTDLWETNLFLDPDHINRGLDIDENIVKTLNSNSGSTNLKMKHNFEQKRANSSLTTNSLIKKWTYNESDLPTLLTLLPDLYVSTKNLVTSVPNDVLKPVKQVTKNPVVSTTHTIYRKNGDAMSTVRNNNVSKDDIQKAKKMFDTLNETSTNTLMDVIRQAENNFTVRKLVLLLISYNDEPISEKSDNQKQELLRTLLRIPIHGKKENESEKKFENTSTNYTSINTPSVDIRSHLMPGKLSSLPFISRFTTPKISLLYNGINKLDGTTVDDKQYSILEKRGASEKRALELLRSIYSIAAKWG
ncbi:uncharacterized protein LOC106640384 [Copidosoma floridanum]|uniref:uncharacterized protein LOC106640384 n=1 Tax=Copidosoma floridanum TaxID=29053 RepID=UPI0006C965E7|nr:uncharacterized protein LOC106640384 [Copidosoma floridanum]